MPCTLLFNDHRKRWISPVKACLYFTIDLLVDQRQGSDARAQRQNLKLKCEINFRELWKGPPSHHLDILPSISLKVEFSELSYEVFLTKTSEGINWQHSKAIYDARFRPTVLYELGAKWHWRIASYCKRKKNNSLASEVARGRRTRIKYTLFS